MTVDNFYCPECQADTRFNTLEIKEIAITTAAEDLLILSGTCENCSHGWRLAIPVKLDSDRAVLHSMDE